MKKLFNWSKEHILFLLSLFLLAFIPLYPKLPLIDIKNVWVYIRIEDFVVFATLLIWGVSVARNRQLLRTPLTMPIFLFWTIGVVTTVHAMLLIFPGLADVYPNVAFLGFLRRVEYMSLFFIAYVGMRDKRFLSPLVIVLTTTLFLIIGYGIGQKYLGFPAFLTMNEEFAKGIAIQLSALSRVSATFGGHYDLAAYLVLVIPIMVSLMFGYKHIAAKIMFLLAAAGGFVVLFMTVSRISVFALFISLGLVFLFQKRKFVLLSVPVIGLLLVLLFSFAPSLLNRFGSTVKEVNVLINTNSGGVVGHIQEVPNTYFEKKTVKQQFIKRLSEVNASPSSTLIIPYASLPPSVVLLTAPSAPTGEDLPEGTGYINLSLSPVTRRVSSFLYERSNPATQVEEVLVINGDYLVKKALAYDLSFTTRFQAEWPKAIEAFKRNVFFGSGYGSVSLAVDNSYLRMLAEVGLLGFVSFFLIFIIMGVYLYKTLPAIESKPLKSFVYGFVAGLAGIMINALFIDVFEASKVAFVLWLLAGAVVGLVHTYQQTPFDVYRELKKILTSTTAMVIYIGVLTIVLYSPLTRNYFVGDDFTWFRWVADCGQQCGNIGATIWGYVTQAEGFFYRPGAKVYYLFMYNTFWLNQTAYHTVSLLLHFIVATLVFFLAQKVFSRTVLAVSAAALFLLLSGYSEAVFWISATGFLFTSAFSLASLLSYIHWRETRKAIYLAATIVLFVFATLFHELGIVTPLLYLLYNWTFDAQPLPLGTYWKNPKYAMLFLPVVAYILVRAFAQSHWLSGDYNYNVLKLPVNSVGNAVGYFLTSTLGPIAGPVYQMLRSLLRAHAGVAIVIGSLFVGMCVVVYKKVFHLLAKHEKRILLFGVGFFIITLLPFLGLGNITSRYSYLASVGVVFVLIFLFQKLYAFLLAAGRDIAVVSVSVLVGIFCLFQIVELRQVHGDWYGAGEKVRRFIVSMDSMYSDGWTTEKLDFHFVHVPIRSGEAWIFPVGLPDALWFVFRNPNIRVYTWSSVEDAFPMVDANSLTERIFVFNGEGMVTEVKKPTVLPK